MARVPLTEPSTGVATGDWRCACGQRYRVLDDGDVLTLWAATGRETFSREAIEILTCVRGCAIDPDALRRDAVWR